MNQDGNQQDIVRCHYCENQPSLYCELCREHVCNACKDGHIAEKSIDHKIAPFKKRSYIYLIPECQNHSKKSCESHCIQCDAPLCSDCISSGQHENHNIIDILEGLDKMKVDINRDLQEFRASIYPKYRSIAESFFNQIEYLHENCEKISKALDKVREDWHREIDCIINELKSDINKMKSKHSDSFKEKENETNDNISEIKQIITNLKELLNSHDVSIVAAYKSRNSEFRNLPKKVRISLPDFAPYQIDKEQIYQQFSYLSKWCIEPEAQIITEVNTEYEHSYRLRSVTCLNSNEIWTRGTDNIMRLYNLQGEQVRAIQTKSKNMPLDIAVTREGHLLYTDMNERTINMVKNSDIYEVNKLPGWNPYGIHCATSGDLLVVMDSDDHKHTKVVRFSANEEKNIQFNNIGQPLFSSARSIKYITENKNRDICMADCGANAVVVVNQNGKFRFKYNPYTPKGRLKPYGIATDSRGWILVSDGNTDYIHILDQEGAFLRFIDNCDLSFPWGLCVDNKDNLVVAEVNTGKLKIIQY